MTVKELASKMNELMRNGCPDHFVFISFDNQVSFPAMNIYKMHASINGVCISSISEEKDQQSQMPEVTKE